MYKRQAYRVEQDEQAVDTFLLLNCDKLRNYMLVFRRLILGGKDGMAFNLPDYGEAVDGVLAVVCNNGPGFVDFVSIAFADGTAFLQRFVIIVILLGRVGHELVLFIIF